MYAYTNIYIHGVRLTRYAQCIYTYAQTCMYICVHYETALLHLVACLCRDKQTVKKRDRERERETETS